jgi:serine/threonine protein kinase
MKIVHRDLKSANCLVNKHMTVKICDFGLSRVMTDTPIRDSSSAGTPEWMAPELIRNEPFTEKCDIFSLGVIMWELCTLNRPWEGVPPERVCLVALISLQNFMFFSPWGSCVIE